MKIESLWHFPVKGLEGACRDQVHLETGRHFPDDRIFAIGNGHARHDETPAGSWHKKAFFLQQMQFEQLAELRCAFDGTRLDILHRGRLAVSADMGSDDGIETIDSFFAGLVGYQIPGIPHLMRIVDGSYADTKDALISLGGTASVNAFAAATDDLIPPLARHKVLDRPLVEVVRAKPDAIAVRRDVLERFALAFEMDEQHLGSDLLPFACMIHVLGDRVEHALHQAGGMHDHARAHRVHIPPLRHRKESTQW